MPDLLTHVLAGYVVATLLAYRYDWLTAPYVTAAMIGAALPDLAKTASVVPESVIAALYGLPLAVILVHTIPGSIAAIAIGSLAVAREHRRRVFALAVLGAMTHHALDLLIITSDGTSYPVFAPFSSYEPELPQLFRSSDRWPALLGLLAATVSWYLVRYRSTED